MKMSGTGYLAKDAEIKTFESGGSVISFVIPKTEKWKNKEGELQERTEWHEFKLHIAAGSDKRLAYLKDVLVKGAIVSVVAKQVTEKWEKENQKFSKIVYKIDEIEVFGKKLGDSAAADAPTETDKPVVDNSNDDEDGLPF